MCVNWTGCHKLSAQLREYRTFRLRTFCRSKTSTWTVFMQFSYPMLRFTTITCTTFWMKSRWRPAGTTTPTFSVSHKASLSRIGIGINLLTPKGSSFEEHWTCIEFVINDICTQWTLTSIRQYIHIHRYAYFVYQYTVVELFDQNLYYFLFKIHIIIIFFALGSKDPEG